MKVWLPIAWRWSWVVTLPIVCVFIYWGWVTSVRFNTFGMRFNSSLGLHKAGVLEFKHLKRLGELSSSGSINADLMSSGPIRSMHLFVPEAKLAQLDSNLPHSGFHYVKGGLWDGEKIRKVKLRYRGDSIYHWGSYKKSLRIKTKKQRLFEGLRAFNLVAPRTPEMLNNYLSFRLGSILGLISPKVEMVNLSINGKNSGIYVLTEQLEELTLRNHNRMPGDLYSGELIGSDHYRGITNWLFDNAELWEKVAINNHYPEESKKPMERLIQLVNASPTEDVHAELSGLVDMEAFGRFSVLEILAGTAHVDGIHNWRLYYDPMRSKFIPVVWDLVGWHSTTLPPKGQTARLDVITSPLHQAMHMNADFLRARDRALKDFFMTGLDQKFLKELSSLIDDLSPYINHDPNLAPDLEVVTPGQSVKALLELKSNIERIFVDVRKGYFQIDKQDAYAVNHETGALALSIDGRSVVEQVVFKYLRPFSQVVTCHLTFWKNSRQQVIDISGALKQQGSTITVDLPLLAKFVSEIRTMTPGKVIANRLSVDTGYYEFSFSGVSPENTLQEVKVDRGLGAIVDALKTVSLERKEFKDVFLISKEKPVANALIWSEDVVVDGAQTIEGELLIRPGTSVRFRPGASLLIKGRVLAEGNPDKPIRFIQLDSSQNPWGAVVLVGKVANGSRFKYCEFEGGSGLKGDLFEYTAMFSVHDVRGVVVENCTFRDSKITDDMVHTVYAEVRFSDCTFERSLMDALDIDISDAVIERCRFVNSGNDSIDLMTSNAVVLDTIIENGGDKAASVGEGSNLLAINNVFRNNVIGVQVKDGSVASIYNTDFIGNDHALDAYKKNWRYNDGGDIYVYKSRFTENDKMITADKKSKIRVFDSCMDRVVATDKRVKIDETVGQLKTQQPHNTKLVRHKKQIETMKEFDSRYWDRINSEKKGAVNVAND